MGSQQSVPDVVLGSFVSTAGFAKAHEQHGRSSVPGQNKASCQPPTARLHNLAYERELLLPRILCPPAGSLTDDLDRRACAHEDGYDIRL